MILNNQIILPYFIIDNYKNIGDYEEDLSEISKDLDFEVNLIKENQLPHYRFLNLFQILYHLPLELMEELPME